MNAGSLLQSPAEPQSASTVANQVWDGEEKGAQLLELRTAAGIVYVCPGRWQRMRLQWAFRHFRVLPPQVLSRGDQRLIKKLAQSAVVAPHLPVASYNVFGVVENAPSKPAPAPDKLAVPAFTKRQEFHLRHWRVLAGLAVACIAVTLASVYRIPLFSGTVQTGSAHTLSTPTKPVAGDVKLQDMPTTATSPLPAGEVTGSLLNAEKPTREIGSTQENPARPASESSAPATFDTVPESERRFVSELPQGHFAHPVVSERDGVGELRLKALIGVDGSVKQVTVISGSPKLAEIGMRAVRQWHYPPYQVLGSPVEVETQIKISFFGPDAISITSIAEQTASSLK